MDPSRSTIIIKIRLPLALFFNKSLIICLVQLSFINCIYTWKKLKAKGEFERTSQFHTALTYEKACISIDLLWWYWQYARTFTLIQFIFLTSSHCRSLRLYIGIEQWYWFFDSSKMDSTWIDWFLCFFCVWISESQRCLSEL
jgi:hypothetical protein